MAQIIGANSASARVKRVYYANANVAGTATNEQIRVGYPVCFNYAQALPGSTATESRGLVVSKPETANLGSFAGIVTSVNQLPTSNGVANAGAGWIEIITAGDAVPTFVKANATRSVTALIISNGADAWSLTAAQSAGAQLDTVPELFAIVGIANETSDTSSTAAVRSVTIKGPGVCMA